MKKVLREIKEWSEAKNFPFCFFTQATLDLADDEELLRMMADADFRHVFLGIETPENEALRLTQKPQNVNKNISESVRKTC